MTKEKVFISEADQYLFAQGTHYDIYKKLGAHLSTEDGVQGVYFGVWAPNAAQVNVIGTFNEWNEESHPMQKLGEGGIWGLFVPGVEEGTMYKFLIYARDGRRLYKADPFANYAEYRPGTASIVTDITGFDWKDSKWMEARDKKDMNKEPMAIYECHIGMAQQEEKVGSYTEFKEKILPRIVADGYNAIQIMAIQEHPYYGSFGYHVSSFFAPSSRFGTPDELKSLIDEAHKMGIAVIMDIVHSHAVKNEVEGLGRFDGSYNQYFYGDHRREHPAWDSLCFDYGKNDVIHFLLSNCKYWLDEFRFDGFRFDGVTSMLYYNHGLGQAFGSYDDYYNGGQDDNAIVYLTLANELIHQVNPRAITIAEEMSGMPGLAAKFNDGGIGFDYRMAMGIPDFWIKTIKEKKDEDWKPTAIFWELTNRRSDEKTINYAESHDQALVGDKTIIFRLIDDVMYWHMSKGDTNLIVDRGMALHKMIRLVTLSTINGGYLNFMGNEFGHPEWIDFPRQGNGWSYKYARRQWDLVDRNDLKYQYLGAFDEAMIHIISQKKKFERTPIVKLCENDGDQVLAFLRDDLLFVFNFHPFKSFNGYGILAPTGEYEHILSSDDPAFGGYGLIDMKVKHLTRHDPLFEKDNKEWLMLYLPARTAQILRWKKPEPGETKNASKSKKSAGSIKKENKSKKK